MTSPGQGDLILMTNHSGKAHGFSSPFVSQTAPPMALVLERLDEFTALTPTKHRDLKSAIRSFCKLIGKEPAGGVANINWLHRQQNCKFKRQY